MSDDNTNDPSLITELAVEITSAYVRNNPVAPSQLTSVLTDVHATLSSLSSGENVQAMNEEPAVSVKASLKHDRLICLCCGKSFASLKRHLRSAHDLSPEEYRSKWNLPSDYPMVAPAYSKTRSELSKALGLGRKPSRG